MSHARRQLRDALVARVTGLTTTTTHVYDEEPYSWQATQLPGLLVTVVSEDIQQSSLDAPITLERFQTVEVEQITKSNVGIVALQDTIASEVETALGTPLTVGGKVVYLVPIATDAPQWSGDGDQKVSRITMRFTATIYTAAGSPDTLL